MATLPQQNITLAEAQEIVLGRVVSAEEIRARLAMKGAEKIIGLVAATAIQWMQAGCQLRRTALKSGAKALVLVDPIWGKRVIVTERVDMSTRLALTYDERVHAAELPSAIMDGSEIGESFPRLCAVLPFDGKQITPLELTIDGVTRQSLVLPIPPLCTMLRKVPELANESRLLGDWMLIAPELGGLVDAVNLLARQDGLGEFQLHQRCWRTSSWAGMLTRLFPRQFKGRDGQVVTIWGDLAKLLFGKPGAFRQLRDIRVPGGASLLLLTGPEVAGLEHFDHCLVPRRWADQQGIRIGDLLMVARRPSCQPVCVKVIGYSDKGLYLNAHLIRAGMLSDCDGDLIQVWPLPHDITPGEMMASRVFQDLLLVPQEEKPLVAEPVDYSTASPIKDALLPHAGNKLRMGPVTAVRYVTDLHLAFRNVSLGELLFDEEPYNKELGRPLVRSTRVADAFHSLLHWWSEATINKHVVSSGLDVIRQGLDMLDLAHRDPTASWKAWMAAGGHMAKRPDQLAEWCEYLHTLPFPLSIYFKSPPAERALHEAPSRQSLPDVMRLLDGEDMFSGLR